MMPKPALRAATAHKSQRFRELEFAGSQASFKYQRASGRGVMTTMTLEAVDEILRRQPMASELTDAQLEGLAQLGHFVEFAPDEIIHREGDECAEFYVLVCGHVAIEMVGHHEVFRVETVMPGGEFGWTAMLAGAGRYFQARALDRVQAVAFNASRVRELCDQDASLGYALMRRLLGVVAGRLQSTRLQVTDTLSTAAKRAGA
jgi:CRP-like cAMP-binding protein